MLIEFKPYSLNIKKKLFTINEPKVMGILNTSNESFFDGGKYHSIDLALKRVEEMLNEGADFIDIGGESTKPGSLPVSYDVELKRTIPVIEAIMKNFPDSMLSIDTSKSKIAEEAILAGASIINDVSAGDADEKMLQLAAINQVPFIAMHKQGTPETMQLNPHYNNVVEEVLLYLSAKKEEAIKNGITDLIIDPGFGFGKTLAHNYSLLRNLSVFQILNCPVLVGLSRKGMIWKALNTNAEHALNGTIAANTISLLQGAHILRVHDVKEAKDAIKIVSMTKHKKS